MFRNVFFIFVALIGLFACSMPGGKNETSAAPGFYASEEALFKNCYWSGSSGNGFIFYLEMKNGSMELRIWENGSFTTYVAIPGSISLNGNVWSGKFQHPSSVNVIYTASMVVNSKNGATGSFHSAGSNFPTIHMGKTIR